MPEKKLKAGDVGTVVHVYYQEKAFEVEFMMIKDKKCNDTVIALQKNP